VEDSYSAPVQSFTEWGGSGITHIEKHKSNHLSHRSFSGQPLERISAKVSNDSSEDNQKRPYMFWKPVEEHILLMLYKKYPDNWKKISSELESHEPEDCRKHYHALTNTQEEGRWTKEELELLAEYYPIYQNRWKLLAVKIPTRTADQIKDKVRDTPKWKVLNPFGKKQSEIKIIKNFGVDDKITVGKFYPSIMRGEYFTLSLIYLLIEETKETECGDTPTKMTREEPYFRQTSNESYLLKEGN
jgi:hypothetical protein